MAGQAQAAADIMKVLFGKGQGGIAPAFQSGQMGGMGELGMGPEMDQMQGQMFQQALNRPQDGGLADALAQLPVTQGQPQLPIGAAGTQPQTENGLFEQNAIGQAENPLGTTQQFENPIPGGGALGMTKDFGNPLDNPPPPENQTGFGGFFGNMDQNLQSPSKVIGMGLLGQIDPALGYGGLLASGLFGKNKLFGGK